MNKTKQTMLMTGAIFGGALLSSTNTPSANADTLTIKYGDTLSEIALNHGTTVEKLMKANNLSNDKIYAGSTLEIEDESQKDSKFKADKDGKYIVKNGDTLSQIAEANNISLTKLVELNGLNSDLIFVDQVLTVVDPTQENIPQTPETNTSQNYSASPSSVTTESAEQTAQQIQSAPTNSDSTQYSVTNSQNEESAKAWIANKESGGSYTAQNGQYYGKYQLTNSYLNGDYSPENQERVADNYVKNRYGSWANAQAFWQVNGWY